MTEIDEGPAPGVRSMFVDREGNFWFSSNISYKYKVSQNNASVEPDGLEYKQLKGIDTSGKQKLPNYFMAIVEDDQGDIWMATYDEGVWKYDGKKVTHYPITDKNTDVLIFTIYKDNAGDLWLGTHNAGAMKFNGRTFERFNPSF
jgi:ligand-binding sensor domain-containing protein